MQQKPPIQKQQQQQQQNAPKTIEDYRNNIKLLKLKLMKVMKEKEELQKLISNTVQQNTILNYTDNDDLDPDVIDWNSYSQNKNRSRSKSPFDTQQFSTQQQQQRDPSPQLNPQQYDEFVVKSLCKGAARLGFTPESIFRAADIQCRGEISNNQFKMFLKKTKLGLRDSHIQRLISICDEECQGIIRREYFYNMLAAYDVQEEAALIQFQQMQPSQDSTSNESRTFTQKCMIKLAKIFTLAKKTPSQYFNNSTNIGVEQLQELAKQNSKFEKMSNSEVIAAFNYLDPERTGQILISQLTREMQKLSSNQQNLFDRASSFGNAEEGNLASQQSQLNTPKFQIPPFPRKNSGGAGTGNGANSLQMENNTSNSRRNSKSNKQKMQTLTTEESEEPASSPNNKQKRSKTKKRTILQIKNITNDQRPHRDQLKVDQINRESEFAEVQKELDLFAVLQGIAKTGQKKRNIQFNQQEIKQVINEINSKASKDSIPYRVFRLLDMNSNGSLDVDEILKFFFSFRQKEWDYDLSLEFVALKFRVSKKSADEEVKSFLNDHQKDFSQGFDLNLFYEFAQQEFGISQKDQALSLFQYLTQSSKKGGADNNKLGADQLIAKIQQHSAKYIDTKDIDKSALSQSVMSPYSPNKSIQKSMLDKMKSSLGMGIKEQKSALKLGMSSLNFDEQHIQEVQSILQRVKPHLDEEQDYLSRVELLQEQSGRLSMKLIARVPTVLNSEIACLMKCFEIVNVLQNQQQNNDADYQGWKDPDFGPTDADPYGAKSMYFSDNDQPPGCPQPEDVQWLRPEEILRKKAENLKGNNNDNSQDISALNELEKPIMFIYEGATSSDVKQGMLGDCWFISALSLIASNDDLIRGTFDPKNFANKQEEMSDEEVAQMSSGIYPPVFHFLAQYRIYVLRFYKDFCWRYVIVDDRLPCKSDNGEIIFAHAASINELWVSLIEKAYAKLHGCYQALISGDVAQGLSDMTGLVSLKMKLEPFHKLKSKEAVESGQVTVVDFNGKKVDLSKLPEKERWQRVIQEKDNMWENILLLSCNRGAMMGCSAEGETEGVIFRNGDQSTGIYSGHAYAIIDIFILQRSAEELELIKKKQKEDTNYHKNHRILRIRNPWGFGEWQLKWSEQDQYREKLFEFKDQIDQYYQQKVQRAHDLHQDCVEPYVFTKQKKVKKGTISQVKDFLGSPLKSLISKPNVKDDHVEHGDDEMKEDDGTFLMCYKDWREIFDHLFICHKFEEGQWSGWRFKGQWTSETSSGSVKRDEESYRRFAELNPQYVININKKTGKNQKKPTMTRLFIQLSQTDGRMFYGEKYPYERVINSVLLCVFKLDVKENKLAAFSMDKMVVSSGMYNLYREVNTGIFEVENGKYAIIPSTRQAGKEGNFSISIYFDSPDESELQIQQIGNSNLDAQLILDLEQNKLSADLASSREIKQIIKKCAKKSILADTD